MATSIDSAMCLRHMFSADRSGAQTNVVNGNLDKSNVRLIKSDYTRLWMIRSYLANLHKSRIIFDY